MYKHTAHTQHFKMLCKKSSVQ